MKAWESEERRLASRRGGARTGGSGSGWRRRGDVREGRRILWEQKTTANKSFTITETMWEKLRRQALMDGFTPALHITIGAKKRRLILVEEDDYSADHPPDSAA